MSGRAATKSKIPGKYALSVGLTDMEAPPGWIWVPLTDIARLETGHTPSRGVHGYWDGKIPWIGIKDAKVHHGKIIHETFQKVTKDGLDNSAARLLPSDTVCLSRTASVGYVLVMGKPMATSQDFVNWVCSQALDPHYLMHLLISEKESLLKFGKGTTHKTIYFPEVKAFHVCIPPKNEQRRIAAKIEALQHRTRRARTALAAIPPLLEKFRQSILSAAFRGDLTADWRARNADVEPASALLERIRAERRRRWEEAELAKMAAKGKVPKDDRWKMRYNKGGRRASRSQLARVNAMARAMVRVPEDWEIVQLGDVVKLQPGYAFKSQWFTKSGIRLLRGTNVVPGGTRWSDNVYLPADKARRFSEYLLKEGDLIIAMDRPIISTGIKVTRLTEDDVPALLLQRVGRFRIEDGVSPEYIMHFLNSGFFISHISGQETGTQLPHISQSDIEAVLIPIPPEKEQLRIVSQVETLLDRIDIVCREVPSACDGLDKLEGTILAKAFRGELVPQDPKDEPASKLLERIRAEKSAQEPARRGRRKAKPTPAAEHAQLPLELERTPEGEPERGMLANARDYTLDDWRRALIESLGDEPADRQDAIEAAAIWAAENMGLVYERLPKNGLIVRGLKSALRSAIRRGEVERLGPSRVRRIVCGWEDD